MYTHVVCTADRYFELIIARTHDTGWMQGVEGGDDRYLLPLLPGGPNNQALAFRQAVALALMLNRTVLLTGIVEHPSTARRSSDGLMRRPMFYRMEDLYNW